MATEEKTLMYPDKCYLCGTYPGLKDILMFKKEPDKYEISISKNDICRAWIMCPNCGLYYQMYSYPRKDLVEVYKKMYRSSRIRNGNIKEKFNAISMLPPSDSENFNRLMFWLEEYYKDLKFKPDLLDVGAGLGVWLHSVENFCFSCEFDELNEESIEFIRNHLSIRRRNRRADMKYDCISIIHVLEHVEDPVSFLLKYRKLLNPNGVIFLEVPSANEFNTLYSSHDEFNSCHHYFFDPMVIRGIASRANLRVVSQKNVTTFRGLERSMYILDKSHAHSIFTHSLAYGPLGT